MQLRDTIVYFSSTCYSLSQRSSTVLMGSSLQSHRMLWLRATLSLLSGFLILANAACKFAKSSGSIDQASQRETAPSPKVCSNTILELRFQPKQVLNTASALLQQQVMRDALERQLQHFELGDTTIKFNDTGQIHLLLPPTVEAEKVISSLTQDVQLEFRAQKRGTEELFRALFFELEALDREQNQLATQVVPEPKDMAINREAIARTHQTIQTLFEPPALTTADIALASLEAVSATPIHQTPVPRHDSSAQANEWQPIEVHPRSNPTRYDIVIRFTPEGASRFAELTKTMAGTGRSIGIFWQQQLVAAPVITVNYADTGITGGTAVISGSFSRQSARQLVDQLNGGSLPVALELVGQRVIPNAACSTAF